jgi:hypothetical protein
MNTSTYREKIVKALQGQLKDMQNVDPSRLEWAGVSAVLELYDKAPGTDRDAIIDAFRTIIRDKSLAPDLVAQAIDLASCLDMAQVETEVKARETPTTDPLLLRSVHNYLAFRHLRG